MQSVDNVLRLLPYKKYYAKIDLKSGYWQFLMEETATMLSTFVTPFGQYRWKRMPFGFKTAPACFQRVMNKILKQMIYDDCIVYLDDVICWADSLEKLEEIISKVCEAMTEAGLKLNGEKSCFLTKKLEVLGHWVEAGLLKPDSEKLQWVKLQCSSVT